MTGNTKIIVQVFAVLAIIILVNVIGSKKFFRYDLTEEKIHSLSPTTINILENDTLIKDELRFEVYLTGDLPPQLRKLQLALKEKLSELKAYGGSKIYYEFIDPAENESKKIEVFRQLDEFGLHRTIVTTKAGGTKTDVVVFGGIILRTVNNENIPIQILDPSYRDPNTGDGIPVPVEMLAVGKMINDLEYLLLEGIYKAVSPNRKKIGFLQGHGELKEIERHDVTIELSKFHSVEDVTIDGKINALKNFDALVIAKPKRGINEKDKYLIDQFIMRGGKVAWLIDPVEVNRDSLLYNGRTFGLERELNDLDRMIFNYGVRLNKDLVIDVNSLKIPYRGELKNWYYYPIVRTERLNNPVVNNVNPIRLKYASTLYLLKNEGVKKTPLLVTSVNSKTYFLPARINYSMIKHNEGEIKYNAQPNRIVGAMLEGKFLSNYRNNRSKNFRDNSPVKHRDESVENKMLVIGDGDIINAEVDSIENRSGKMIYRPMYVNYDRYDRSMVFGNKEFFVNAMEDLMGINDLIPLRSKTITLRPLNKEKVENERGFWKAVNVFIPILVILVFGAFYNFLRRKRYSK